MKLIIVSAIIVVFAQTGRADASEVGKVWAPEITDFRWEQVRSYKHPFLFYRQSDIKDAKKRAKSAKYRQALETLNIEADKARGIVLESIDRSWWDQVNTKSWADTYPM